MKQENKQLLILLAIIAGFIAILSFMDKPLSFSYSYTPGEPDDENDEEDYAPPARGYLGPGTLPTAPPPPPPPPGPMPPPPGPPGPRPYPPYPPYPYPYAGAWYGSYPYTDALVVSALASEAANVAQRQRCYREVPVKTGEYGTRSLCLNKAEYLEHLRKRLSYFRTEYDNAVKGKKFNRARNMKQQVNRFKAAVDAELKS